MIKSLLLSLLVIAAPSVALSQTSADNEIFCGSLSRLSRLTAVMRDEGISASETYAGMTANDISKDVALLVVKIVFEETKYMDPRDVEALTYISCMDATRQ